jgi:hypothetical protein
MSDPIWLQRLEWLAMRFSHLGVTADLAGMTTIELWGVYCLLCRLNEAAP